MSSPTLEDRVRQLEDELMKLQLRFVPATRFSLTQFAKCYFLRLHLTVGAWPVTTEGQQEFCAKFFRQLRICCNISSSDARLSVCVHHTPTSSVLEGVLDAHTPAITSPGIAAAFERAWDDVMVGSTHKVLEIGVEFCETVASAIHVLNQRAIEFRMSGEGIEELDLPDCADVTEDLISFKPNLNPFIFKNPMMQQVFPDVFSAA